LKIDFIGAMLSTC